ncbi:MAG: glycosyltransferase [Hyphomonas sp.]|nr:glycosyltransferase [Hyphomonas sp.]
MTAFKQNRCHDSLAGPAQMAQVSANDDAPRNTVTVLIPTFNRAEWLEQSLRSILSQTRRPDEIIVINDGSTDGTLAMLKAYAEDVRVLSQANSGKAAALNKGLSKARGDLIWVFDDDDIAAPDALETLVSALAASPNAAFAYGRHSRFEIDGNGRKRSLPGGYWRDCAPESFLFETMLDMFVHQQAMLVPRALYEQVGGFDERLIRSQDYEMLLRLAQAGNPVATSKVIFQQRVHDAPRGTLRRQFRGADRDRVWQAYDRVIFGQVRDTVDLAEFLGPEGETRDPAGLRHALIRRGIVMARKNLWSLAMKDFTRAAEVADSPLTRLEREDLRKTFMSKYASQSMKLGADVRRMLCDLAHVSGAGRQMSAILARALVWRVRQALMQGHLKCGLQLVDLILRLIYPVRRTDQTTQCSYSQG